MNITWYHSLRVLPHMCSADGWNRHRFHRNTSTSTPNSSIGWLLATGRQQSACRQVDGSCKNSFRKRITTTTDDDQVSNTSSSYNNFRAGPYHLLLQVQQYGVYTKYIRIKKEPPTHQNRQHTKQYLVNAKIFLNHRAVGRVAGARRRKMQLLRCCAAVYCLLRISDR